MDGQVDGGLGRCCRLLLILIALAIIILLCFPLAACFLGHVGRNALADPLVEGTGAVVLQLYPGTCLLNFLDRHLLRPGCSAICWSVVYTKRCCQAPLCCSHCIPVYMQGIAAGNRDARCAMALQGCQRLMLLLSCRCDLTLACPTLQGKASRHAHCDMGDDTVLHHTVIPEARCGSMEGLGALSNA